MAALIRRGGTGTPRWLDAQAGHAAESDAADVLRLEPADEPAQFAHRLGAVSRVEVNFPSFTDGRGYSIARLLRERHGFRGELRAFGDIWPISSSIFSMPSRVISLE